MARKKHDSAAETLDLIEGVGDRFAVWIGTNRVLVLSCAAGVLVAAGAYALITSSLAASREAATSDLAQVQMEFATAMGGTLDDLELPEPANPETGRRVRRDFIERYRQVAEDHEGSPSAWLAVLELGELQYALGEPDEALETWHAAAMAAEPQAIVRALLLERAAGVYEEKSQWREAGELYEQAGGVEIFPLRWAALADAARCYAEAGETAQALEVFARLETEAPEQGLPAHVQSRLRELRARQRDS